MTISPYRPVQERPIQGLDAPQAVRPSSSEPAPTFTLEPPPPAETPAATQTPQHSDTTPQFANSLVIALLNAQEQFYTPGPVPALPGHNAPPEINGRTRVQSTAYISNGGLPGGLDLSNLDPANAANTLIDAAGANGKIDFSGIQMVLGGLGEADGPFSVRANVTRVWDKLTQGRGSMDAVDLTKAIQKMVDGAKQG